MEKSVIYWLHFINIMTNAFSKMNGKKITKLTIWYIYHIIRENTYDKINQLREPYSKHVEDGIFELRCKFGSDITRVMYFFFDRGKIILTNGFVKKTQKTPVAEIQLAKARRADYMERMKKL